MARGRCGEQELEAGVTVLPIGERRGAKVIAPGTYRWNGEATQPNHAAISLRNAAD